MSSDVEGMLIYDATVDDWYRWNMETVFPGDGGTPSEFQIKSITPQTDASAHGIFNNGDIFGFNDGIFPLQAFDEDASNTSLPIELEIVTNKWDAGTYRRKTLDRLNIIGEASSNNAANQNIDVSFSDDDYQTFSTPRTLDLAGRASLHQWGMFNRRAFKLEYSELDRVWLQEIELAYNQHSS
jgi:hypothetical protein